MADRKTLTDASKKIAFTKITAIVALCREVEALHTGEGAFGADVWGRIAKDFTGKRDRWMKTTPATKEEAIKELEEQLAVLKA